MQKFIHALKEEHRLIERAAACLDRLTDEAIAGEDFDAVAALDLLEFLEHFANEAHQQKEERVLFPALLARGLAGARIGELLLEHLGERQALEALHGELEAAAYGDPVSRDHFAALAHEYALAQIEHASKEDSTLLPIAEEQLDPAQDEHHVRELQAIEHEFGLPAREHYEDALERIAWRIGAMPAAPTLPPRAALVPAAGSAEPACERLSARLEPPLEEQRFLLEDCCGLDRADGCEAIVTLLAGQVIRERGEDLALEPAAEPSTCT